MKKFIQNISNNLFFKDDDIWFSQNKTNISYPKEGNDLYYKIEEKSFWFKHRNICLTTVISKYINKNIFFDVGGGNGFVSWALKQNKIEVALVEPGIKGILNAKKRGLKNLICSTFNDAGFKKNSIPNIGIFDVLEHIENDIDFLKKMNNVLEDQGKLIITVPAYNFLWSNDDRHVGHYRRYTLKQIKTKLAKAGFKIEYGTYIFSLLPLPIFLFRTIPSIFKKTPMKNIGEIQKEHKSNSFFERLLMKETSIIEKNKRIPFGSSCLVVATKIVKDSF